MNFNPLINTWKRSTKIIPRKEVRKMKGKRTIEIRSHTQIGKLLNLLLPERYNYPETKEDLKLTIDSAIDDEDIKVVVKQLFAIVKDEKKD